MMVLVLAGAVALFIVATVCMCAMYMHTYKSDYDKKIEDDEQEEAVRKMAKHRGKKNASTDKGIES